MTETDPKPGLNPAAAGMTMDDLAELLKTFNDTTEKLKSSHDTLRDRVVELQHELEEKNAELRRKNRLAVLGEMAAILAHEIRNPLGGIEMFANLLVRDLSDNTDATRLVNKILVGARQLNTLVEDMLTFTRSPEPRFQEIALRDAVEPALAYVDALFEQKSITVEKSLVDTRLAADPDMVQRAVMNLCVNAVQAMSEGGTLELSATTEPLNGHEGVRFVVRDSGPGIPEEAMKNLFTTYYTDKVKGTGLGLTIVHRIIEAHRGTIEAENRPEGGAEFRFWIPNDPLSLPAPNDTVEKQD